MRSLFFRERLQKFLHVCHKGLNLPLERDLTMYRKPSPTARNINGNVHHTKANFLETGTLRVTCTSFALLTKKLCSPVVQHVQ